jgi:hypothetical protein
MLPEAIRDRLARHLDDGRQLYSADLARGFGRVVLPDALAREVPWRTDRLE